MQANVTTCRQEVAFVNGAFIEAKCTKSTSYIQNSTIKQKCSKVEKVANHKITETHSG